MSNSIKVRHAVQADSKDLWMWRNDPTTRQNSINKSEIGWDDHSVWYEKSLKNSFRKIFVGIDENTNSSIGMVRFDIDKKRLLAKVSINLNPIWRSKGVSANLLKCAIDEMQKNKKLVMIAEIKPQNVPSIKCFERCFFALDKEEPGLLVFKNKQWTGTGAYFARKGGSVSPTTKA